MKTAHAALIGAIVLFLFFVSPLFSRAQPYTFTWDPGQSGFSWNVSANWSGGPSGHWPDDNYDRAVFSTAAGNPVIVTDVKGNVGNGLGQLDFQTSGWAINNETGGDYTIYFDSATYYNNNAIYSRVAGLNYINTKVQFSGANQSVLTGTGSTIVFAGPITGSYTPIISSLNPTSSDTGAVRLDTANPVGGSFLIRQGALLVRHSNALGSGTSLTIGDSYSTDGANARLLTDASGVTISQNITVQNNPNHQVNATIGGNQTSGQSTFSGAITLNRSANFTSANADGNAVAFNNTITGIGSVTKVGPGTVVFNHANSYQGATTIAEGTLRLGAVGALPSSTSVTLANVASAVLDLNGYDQAFSSLLGGGSAGGTVYLGNATLALNGGNFAGMITGSGGITKVGSGTLILSGHNLYTGPTTINSGALEYGAHDVLGSGAVVVDGPNAVLNIGSYNDTVGSVTLDRGAQIIGSGTLSSATSFDFKDGTVSASLGGVAHLNKTTLGTVTLNGANTFSGDTRVQYGILRVGHGLALQNSTVHLSSEDQGTLDLNALDVTLGGLKGVRDLQIPDGRKLSVGYNNNSTTYAGTLKGKDVVLEKIGTGTFIITGDNIYSGVTKISAGALQIGDGGTSGSINTPIENNGVLWFNRADSLEFKKTISGSGNLVKVGQGTLVLSGDNNYTGNTIVQQGTLLVNGNYAGNGTFQVGSLAATTAVLGGIGTITGNVYAAQLGEISPGTSIGTLSIEGNVILAGTLRVELNAEGTGFADMLLVSGVFDINSASLVFSYDSPPDDPAYIFVTYGSRTGKGFVRVDNLPPGYRIDYNYLGQNKIAIVVPEPVGGPGTLLVAVGAHTIIQRLKNRRGTTRTPRRETRAGS